MRAADAGGKQNLQSLSPDLLPHLWEKLNRPSSHRHTHTQSRLHGAMPSREKKARGAGRRPRGSRPSCSISSLFITYSLSRCLQRIQWHTLPSFSFLLSELIKLVDLGNPVRSWSHHHYHLCDVCMFSSCQWGFFLGSPASSRSAKNMQVKWVYDCRCACVNGCIASALWHLMMDGRTGGWKTLW